MTARRKEQGFALAETLVAVAILAGMTALLYDSIASNARVSRLAEQRRAAVVVAQSALALATTSVPPRELLDLPTQHGYVATLAVGAYDTNARSGGPPLEHIVVTVTHPPEAALLARLETLRLKR
jgi:type II secretory pathway pseudopilin PulG